MLLMSDLSTKHDNDIRVGKQLFKIFMDNIYTTKFTILKYTQKLSSYGLYTCRHTYMHIDRETDTYTHVSLTQMV